MASLREKAIKGFKWTGLDLGINITLNTIMVLLLAILLGPREYGIVAIITLLIGLIKTFSEFGLAQAIIQKQNLVKNEIISLFWCNLLIGISMAIIVLLLSDPIASYYKKPDISILIKILSVYFIFESSSVVFRALLEKELMFNILAMLNILKVLTSSVVTILLILINYGAMGFVIGQISGVILYFIIIIYLHRIRIIENLKFRLKIEDLKPFLRFGVYVAGNNFLSYFTKNFDEIIIGRIIGVEALGIYHLAKQIIAKVVQFISTTIKKVNFPLFSKYLKDREKTKSISILYLKLNKIVSLIGFPVFGLIFLFSPFIIINFFGEEWTASIIIVQIFCIKALFDILSAGFASSLLYAKNKPRTMFLVDLCLSPVRLALIFLAALINIEAVAVAYLLVVLTKVLVLQQIVNKLISISMIEYFKHISKPLIITSILVLLLRNIYVNFTNIVLTISIFVIYVTIYFIIIKILEPKIVSQIQRELGKLNLSIKFK